MGIRRHTYVSPICTSVVVRKQHSVCVWLGGVEGGGGSENLRIVSEP
jgi:hypothetical protein